MKLIFHLILINIYVSLSRSSIYTYDKNDGLSLLGNSRENPQENAAIYSNKEKKKKEVSDMKKSFFKLDVTNKIKDVKRMKAKMKSNMGRQLSRERYKKSQIGKAIYHKDPVLNYLSRRMPSYSPPTSGSESSSMELKKWKDEWKERWLMKKFEAINATPHRGDTVNMVGARPWGVPCGDPNQHDMPWGSCMLPMECDSEYRIYRGDYFCGRTQFVCCALMITNYDMYQGFDASFDDSNLATDSAEKENRMRGSKEMKRRKKQKEKKRRRRDRLRRKRKMKRNIKKIIREIQKILKRSYRNGTTARKKKTKQLKKFIEALKKQYKKDRHSVKDIHQVELEHIDTALQTRLNQIKGMNQDFAKNGTYRDIIVNGTINPKVARMLMESYPDLVSMVDSRRANRDYKAHRPREHLNYDIEYGLLYY